MMFYTKEEMQQALDELRSECKSKTIDLTNGKVWYTTQRNLDYRCNMLQALIDNIAEED